MKLDIDKFKKSIDDLSFFNKGEFISKNYDFIHRLSWLLIEKFEDINKLNIDDDLNYQKMSIDESVALAQKFFDNHDIDININDMIKEKKLVFTDEYELTLEEGKDPQISGTSLYDENNERKIEIGITNTIHDSLVLVHEIVHYLNQPEHYRNETSDLLTEALSYTYEYIFCNELDKKYSESQKLHFQLFERLITNFTRKVCDIYGALSLYYKTGDITEDTYNKVYDDNGYHLMINNIEKYITEGNNVMYDTFYVLGVPLGIYMVEEYKKDNSFINKIELLNNSINDKTMEECLNIINIKSLKDCYNKCEKSINKYVILLKELYGNNKKMK